MPYFVQRLCNFIGKYRLPCWIVYIFPKNEGTRVLLAEQPRRWEGKRETRAHTLKFQFLGCCCCCIWCAWLKSSISNSKQPLESFTRELERANERDARHPAKKGTTKITHAHSRQTEVSNYLFESHFICAQRERVEMQTKHNSLATTKVDVKLFNVRMCTRAGLPVT